MLSIREITTQQIVVNKTNHAIYWVDSAIHFLSDQGLAQVVRKVDKSIHGVNNYQYPVGVSYFWGGYL